MIAITQDNILGGSDLLPLHSPLTWLIDETHAGTASDYLVVEVYVDGTLELTQRAIPWQFVSSTIRRFRWDAGVILKSFLSDMDDAAQSLGTLELLTSTKPFTLRFYAPSAPLDFVETSFVGAHGVKQWGEEPNMSSMFNNDVTQYLCASGCYVYYYSATAGGTLQANGSAVVPVAEVGVYRYFDTFAADTAVIFYRDAVGEAVQAVTAQKVCGEYELKYIDRNGQYRFLGFNKFVEITDDNAPIGKVNRFATRLSNGQGSENSVGYRNTRTLALTVEALAAEKLEALSDLESSPFVYLKVGTSWVLVTLKGPGTIRQTKQEFTDLTYLVELPERYSLSLI